MELSTVMASIIPIYPLLKVSVAAPPIDATISGWKMSAAAAPSKTPSKRAMSGEVFFIIMRITIIGTANNHGLTLIDSFTDVKIASVLAVPVVSIFNPNMIKTMMVMTTEGMVVYSIYRM